MKFYSITNCRLCKSKNLLKRLSLTPTPWALTCETFLSKDQWIWLLKEFGYNGDYEFIFFN